MTGSNDPRGIRSMFGSIATRYDLANHLLSGGLHFFWRKRAAAIAGKWAPLRILDLASGSGDLALALARSCPGAMIVGADFCHPMLIEAQRKGMQNLVVADGLRLPFAPAIFDVLTVAFGLRNMASWLDALREMRRVLRPGGHLLILDFSMPPAPLRGLYRFYLRRCLPFIAGVITGEAGAYEYLGDSIELFPQGTAMIDLMEANGFIQARCETLSGGIVSLYSGTRSG